MYPCIYIMQLIHYVDTLPIKLIMVDTGTVYTYSWVGGSWLQQVTITPLPYLSSYSNIDPVGFGSRLIFNGDGDILAVGAPFGSGK